MPEWLIGAVLKTVVRASVPRVRIPIPPPFIKSRYESAFLISLWRGVRVVEGDDLESRCKGDFTAGSNPALSELNALNKCLSL